VVGNFATCPRVPPQRTSIAELPLTLMMGQYCVEERKAGAGAPE